MFYVRNKKLGQSTIKTFFVMMSKTIKLKERKESQRKSFKYKREKVRAKETVEKVTNNIN